MGLTFFGLTQAYKKELHEALVILTMDVEGFSYETWYSMPVNLRNYYMKVIQDVNKKKKQEMSTPSVKRNIKKRK